MTTPPSSSLAARLGAALILLVCLVAGINKGMDIIEEQKFARALREAESLAAVRELAKAAVHEALERPEGARGGRHQTRDGGNAHLHEPLRN